MVGSSVFLIDDCVGECTRNDIQFSMSYFVNLQTFSEEIIIIIIIIILQTVRLISLLSTEVKAYGISVCTYIFACLHACV